jgi:hypothetical protein
MMAQYKPKHVGHITVNEYKDDQYTFPVYRDGSLPRRRDCPYVLFQGKHPVITPIHAPWLTGNNSCTTYEGSPTLLTAMPCNMCSVVHRLHREIRFSLLNKRGPGSSVDIATGYGLDGQGIESRWGPRFFAHVQTGPEAHPASCTMGTGSFPGVKRC